MILAVFLIASQSFFEAKLNTFGCTSSEEVLKLQQIRHDEKTFRTELLQQIFYGECVEISKNAIVEGSPDNDDSSMLLVDREIEPPGYIAPSDNFEVKHAIDAPVIEKNSAICSSLRSTLNLFGRSPFSSTTIEAAAIDLRI